MKIRGYKNYKQKNSKQIRGRKKQDWHRSEFNNPYLVKYKAINVKLYAYMALFAFTTLGILYFIFFSKFLVIREINITGNDDQYKKQINEIVKNFLAKKKVTFLDNSNFFIFNPAKLQGEIDDSLFLSSLSVNKDLPNKINIEFDKIMPKYIWIQGGEYFMVGENGYLIEQISGTQGAEDAEKAFDLAKIKKYLSNSSADLDSLIIYNNIDKDINLKDYVNKDDLEVISRINSSISGKINTDIILYKLNSAELHDLEIHTEQGWVIKLNLEKIDEQLENLYSILKINFKDSQPLEYVDLRYGKKVYFK